MAKRKNPFMVKKNALWIALIVAGLFWYVYGGLMLLRYILGGLLFASFTVYLIGILNGGKN